MDQFTDRLNELINKVSRGRKKDFADLTNVSTSSMTDYCKGSKKPGMDFFTKVAAVVPNINLNWLINGEGEMYYVPETEEDKAKIARVNALTIMVQELIAEGLKKDARIKELQEKLEKKKKEE